MSTVAVEAYFQSFLGVRSILDAAIDGVQAGKVVLGKQSCAVVHDEGWYFLAGEPEQQTLELVVQSLRRPVAERLYCVPVSNAWVPHLERLPLMRAPRHYFERAPGVALSDAVPLDEAFVLRKFDEASLESISAFRNVRSAIAAWGGPQSFLKRSLGYGVFERAGGKLASAAFGYSLARNRLELSVATNEEFRGRGFALAACRELIAACEASGIVPDWNCFMDNAASAALAGKLGYKQVCGFEMFVRAKPSY